MAPHSHLNTWERLGEEGYHYGRFEDLGSSRGEMALPTMHRGLVVSGGEGNYQVTRCRTRKAAASYATQGGRGGVWLCIEEAVCVCVCSGRSAETKIVFCIVPLVRSNYLFHCWQITWAHTSWSFQQISFTSAHLVCFCLFTLRGAGREELQNGIFRGKMFCHCNNTVPSKLSLG